jgi:anti-sigma-K factor RskA
VRGQKPIDRAIEKPTDSAKAFWRVVNYGLANIIIAGLGIGLTLKRRQSRNAYTMAEVNKRKGGAAAA